MRDTDWQILQALYKNPNMTKVANSFYMTQPSLTKRLKQMEEEFGVTIVNRTPKGLSFTPEGRYLADQAERYLVFMKETTETLAAMQKSTEETIVIGSSYTYSKYMLSELLFQYRKEHPSVQFEVVTDQSDALFRKLLDGTVDVGFIRGDYEGALERIRVGKSAACLVTKEPVKMEDLPGLDRIEYKTNDRTREILERWWNENFSTPVGNGMPVGYIDVAWQMIERGFGYTLCFLPEHFANEHNLCLISLFWKDGTPVERNTWFFYPKSKRLSPALSQFVEYVAEGAKAGKNRK